VQAIPPSAKFFATTNCVHGYFQLALDVGEQGPDNTHAALKEVAVPAIGVDSTKDKTVVD
jgi:hypothetical protein